MYRTLIYFGFLLMQLTLESGCRPGVYALPRTSVSYYRTEDNTGRAVQIRSHGFCLIAKEKGSGLTLGGMDKRYYFAGAENGAAGVPLSGLVDSDVYRLVGTEEEFDWAALEPVAEVSRSAGAMLDLGPGRVGLRVGKNNRASLLLPTDFSGVLYVDVDDRHESLGKLYMRKETGK